MNLPRLRVMIDVLLVMSLLLLLLLLLLEDMTGKQGNQGSGNQTTITNNVQLTTEDFLFMNYHVAF